MRRENPEWSLSRCNEVKEINQMRAKEIKKEEELKVKMETYREKINKLSLFELGEEWECVRKRVNPKC